MIQKSISALFALLFTSLFSLAQHIPDQRNQVSELYDICVQYRADEGSLRRFYHIENSPERRNRMEEFYNSYLQKLENISFTNLSVNGQVDYLMVKRDIEDNLHRFSEEGKEFGQIKEWINFAAPIYEIEAQRRRGKKLNAQKVAAQLKEMEEVIEVKKQQLLQSEKKIAPELVRRTKGSIRGYQEALKSVYDFYNGYDPEFSWWVTKAYHHLDTAFTTYSKKFDLKIDSTSLPKDDGSGIIGQPIGRTELLRQLKIQMIPYTPEELVDIAMKEFAWCDRELLKASREMGFGDDWKAAQEKVKQSYVPAGEQPEKMLEIYEESVNFLKQHDLLTIPPLAEETWRITMIPPERQLVSPFFLGGEVLQVAYPTDDMDHDAKMMSMRGNNPHFSRATIHHEIIAGHHLQQFMNRRNKEYRFYYTPFWTEGWALYWELLLWDLDFPQSPEDRIGMLFWRMHRCARIIFSLNYHLSEWTPQECIDYLVDRVGHERANAEGEVRRSFTGNYGPLYQIAYMVGGLQFWQLKKELVDSGKMTYKEFHDAVLQENAMPVEMVRAILTEQDLSKNFETKWRFYNND